MRQEVTQAATEAQLTIEQQQADILQASLDSCRAPEPSVASGKVVTIKQARAAAAEATRLARALQNEVSVFLVLDDAQPCCYEQTPQRTCMHAGQHALLCA